MKTKMNNEIPSFIDHYGAVKPYQGPFATSPTGRRYGNKLTDSKPDDVKLLNNVKEALEKVGLKNGMTISFHHHLRNGDYVLNLVMDEIAAMGIKDITICASSITGAHEPLIKHIEMGVVTGIHTSGLRGKLGKAQAEKNILGRPVIFRTHGGRARAIEAGEVKIDVAFIGAPACDEMGNMNGVDGKSAFGSMGYALVDAAYADKVVAITDNLQPFPLHRISIPMNLVDYVVEVESLGDPALIASGSTRITKNPTELLIAKKAADVLIASGIIREGYSFQAGSGGASLAVCKFLRSYMEENQITGSFAAGGVTSYMTDLLRDGLFKALLDTQTFDATAVESMKKNSAHIEMSASMYANPHNKSCSAHKLDVMILSATEIDENFNINSLTGSTGSIMGALGGAPDTAAGAKMTIVVAPTMRKRIPIVVEKVTNIVTPGDTVDVLITDRGIAVNPLRKDIQEKLDNAGIGTITIRELRQLVESFTGKPEKIQYSDEVVGVIEYRDGTVMDVIYKVLP